MTDPITIYSLVGVAYFAALGTWVLKLLCDWAERVR